MSAVRRAKNFRPKSQPKEVNTTYVNQQLDGFIRNGYWKKSLPMLEAIQKNKTIAHITTYRKFVHLIGCTGSDLKKAREIFDIATKLKKKDSQLFNIMINCYAKCGHFLEARKLYEHMKEKGLNPNSYTYCNLLKSLRKAPEEVLQEFIENELPKEEKASIFVKKQMKFVEEYRKSKNEQRLKSIERKNSGTVQESK
jgi:pentatricopeptide repeat protein